MNTFIYNIKTLNFPDNFGSDCGKEFLQEVTYTQCKIIRQKNKFNMRLFKKYITSIMAFFTPFTFVKLIQFYSITSLGYSRKIRSYGMREKKIFGYIAVSEYHVISKKEENPSLDTIEFLDTYVYVNNPH